MARIDLRTRIRDIPDFPKPGIQFKYITPVLADAKLFAGAIDLLIAKHVPGSIDAVVANAGIFVVKPFTDYTADDFRALVATNLLGFIHITQLAVRQMQAQKTGGSIVSITASLADNPIAGIPASVAMITKGGLESVTGHLAMEYAKQHIRFNAVAPGVVDTPLHANDPKEELRKQNPMGSVLTVEDIAGAVVYLTEASHITGEVLHVDGGAHIGKW